MDLTGRSAIVTGGAGFIGSHLVDRLLEESLDRVVVVDNFFLGDERNLVEAVKHGDRLSVFRIDASNFSAMRDIVKSVNASVLFDLAVVPLPTSLEFPNWSSLTNVSITATACELARCGAIERLIHCSSSEVYGTAQYVPMNESHPLNAITPYAASKVGADKLVESYARTYGVRAVTVRPFNNYGPRQNAGSYAGIIPSIVQRVRHGLPIHIHGDGAQTRDFIFVRDTAEMLVRSATLDDTDGTVLNIASGVETPVKNLVSMILGLMQASDHPVIHVARRAGDVDRHCADTTKASTMFGAMPEPLNSAHLEETIAWYLAHF